MKTKAILLGLMLGSFSTFSQSYMMQNNGVLLSLDRQGNVFDLNQFIKIYELSHKGKNYFINKDKELTVITDKGFVIKKGDKLLPSKIKLAGGTFTLSDKNEISVLRQDGMVFTYDKEEILKKLEPLQAGGNYLFLKGKTPQENAIMTIDSVSGFYSILNKTVLDSLRIDPSKVKTFGGNYFITQEGLVYTVSDQGIISIKDLPLHKIEGVAKIGGNFFVDKAGQIRVIMGNGNIYLPYIPSQMGKVKNVGYNYFTDENDALFTVVDMISESELSSSDPHIFDTALRKMIRLFDQSFDGRSIQVTSF